MRGQWRPLGGIRERFRCFYRWQKQRVRDNFFDCNGARDFVFGGRVFVAPTPVAKGADGWKLQTGSAVVPRNTSQLAFLYRLLICIAVIVVMWLLIRSN